MLYLVCLFSVLLPSFASAAGIADVAAAFDTTGISAAVTSIGVAIMAVAAVIFGIRRILSLAR